MADKERTGELSMETYFNEGLAQNTEPNNPFEVLEPDQPRKKKKTAKKRSIKRKRVLIALGVIALLLLILWVTLLIIRRRNDGARYARKLSENIGQPIAAAQKAAGVTLSQESSYSTLNKLYASYQGITESSRSCRIQGVKLPEWAIFCNTDADELTNVTYYNYEVLEKNVFGTERKSYQDPNLISTGATAEQAEAQLGLVPYRIQYLEGKQELREYRYCYEDPETDEIVSYVITAIWNESGELTITDSRRNYIGTLLASPAPAEN